MYHRAMLYRKILVIIAITAIGTCFASAEAGPSAANRWPEIVAFAKLAPICTGATRYPSGTEEHCYHIDDKQPRLTFGHKLVFAILPDKTEQLTFIYARTSKTESVVSFVQYDISGRLIRAYKASAPIGAGPSRQQNEMKMTSAEAKRIADQEREYWFVRQQAAAGTPVSHPSR